MKTGALKQILMRAREARRLPGAQRGPALAVAFILDRARTQHRRPVDFPQQLIAKRFFDIENQFYNRTG